MSGFSADWLSLREPADCRARNAGILRQVTAHFAARPALIITDLGCGTGSTLRSLAPLLPARQTWRLVDHDPALLSRVQAASQTLLAARPDLHLDPENCDMHQEIERVLALPADLITLSAFLDLASAQWLDRLAEALARHRLPVYAALSFDGRMQAMPADPYDAAVFAAFHQHQQREKGLGAALGPQAHAYLAKRLRGLGYSLHEAAADWRLLPGEHDLQQMLLAGWADAAAETGLLAAGELAAWAERRRASISRRESRLMVGHQDLWACP